MNIATENNRCDGTALTGRVLLGLIFLLSAIMKIAHWQGMVQMVAPMHITPFLLAGAATLELLGSLLLISGFKARWGAVMLMVFLVPVTLVFHNFWAVQGAAQQEQMANFLKNVSIFGGLLLVLAYGPGRFSVGRNN